MNIIAARQGRGKTTEIYRRIKMLGDEEKIYLIVPEQYTYETECALLKYLNKEAVGNIEVISLTRFAGILAGENTRGGIIALSDEMKNMLVKSIIDKKADCLSAYSKSADKTGFAEETVRAVSELKQGVITPEAVLDALMKAQEPLKSKLSDIYEIYSEYCRLTAGRFYDSEELVLAAAQSAAESKEVSGSYFFFDSFYTFDAYAYPLLQNLMRFSKGVTFTLTWDDTEFFEITDRTKRKLTGAAAKAGDSVEITILKNNKNSSPEICFLEETFTEYKNKKYPDLNKSVLLYEFDSIYKEVQSAAAYICEYIKQTNAHYDDIALTASDIKLYAPVIENVFSHYDIPYYVDMRKKIYHYAPVRAVVLLMEISRGAYTIDDITELMKTGCVPISDDDVSMLENYAAEYGIKAYRFKRDFDFDPGGAYDLERLNRARKILIDFIDKFVSGYNSAATEGERIIHVSGFIKSNLKKIFSANITMASQNGEYERANAYIQIYNKLLDIMQGAYELYKDEACESDRLFGAVKFCLEQTDIGTIPAVIDAVSAGDIVRSRSPEVKLMLVLGVNDGAVLSVPSQGGIFDDNDKRILKTFGIELKNTTGYIIKKENLSLYAMLAKPYEKLYVSALRNEEGARCFVFERLISMFGLIKQDDPLRYITNEQTAYDVICEESKNYEYAKCAAAIRKYFDTECENRIYSDILKISENYKNEAKINDLKSYEAFISRLDRLSVSKLERYAQCPFSFFTRHMLKPKEKKTFGITRPDIGSVIHNCLDNFAGMLLDGNYDVYAVSDEELDVLSHSALQKALDEYAEGIFARVMKSEYFKKKISRACLAAINRTVQLIRKTKFRPEAAEEKFTGIIVDTPDMRFVLEGRIDRVDAFEDESVKYVRVIDYKTSLHEIDKEAIAAGISLQLPVYMNAAAASRNAKAAGMYYFSIRPNPEKIQSEDMLEYIEEVVSERFKLSGIELESVSQKASLEQGEGGARILKDFSKSSSVVFCDEAEIMALSRAADENIEKLACDIYNANISITPLKYKGQTACKLCPYIGICKFSLSFKANKYKEIKPAEKEALA